MISDFVSLQAALETLYGENTTIETRRSVGGGDINVAGLLKLNGGHRVFLKENRKELAGMFTAEALGLEALGSVEGAPPVPEALATGLDGRRAFLLLSEVPPGGSSSGMGPAFGRALAALHRRGRSESCGFDTDNWIGSTPQVNRRMESWIEFFAENRLGYQWKLARKRGYGDETTDRAMDRLLNKLKDLLIEPDEGKASLLHGDLWGGNWMAGGDDRAWLIDPAVYYGHREADLAMTELFGGFPARFREAYREAWPLERGYSERRDLYNLYHLLNHVNLFGVSYWGGVKSTITAYA